MQTYRWKMRAPYFKGAGSYPLKYGTQSASIAVDAHGFFETHGPSNIPFQIVAEPIVSDEIRHAIALKAVS